MSVSPMRPGGTALLFDEVEAVVAEQGLPEVAAQVGPARRRGGRALLSLCSRVVRAAGQAVLQVSHSTMAMVGLTVVAAALFVASRDDLRHQIETLALDWLQMRHVERAVESGDLLKVLAEPEAVSRSTAVDPQALAKDQAAVARWLSRRYKVAPEPLSRLVQEAWAVGHKAGMDPTVILAVMAIESAFNPFAQSPMGAQGLMQVRTRVHTDKYEAFGGVHAAFDPISNLRVGVQVLKECIARAGSLADGLRAYVGAADLDSDGGYVAKVLSEAAHLRNVAAGRSVPFNAPLSADVLREAADRAGDAVPVPARGTAPAGAANAVRPSAFGAANPGRPSEFGPANAVRPSGERATPVAMLN